MTLENIMNKQRTAGKYSFFLEYGRRCDTKETGASTLHSDALDNNSIP
jgi:hypothetical protein